MILKMRQYFYFVTRASLLSSFMMLMSCSGQEGRTSTQQAKPPAVVDPNSDTDSNQELHNILFFGNSLTAGLGLDEVEQAFPALIQAKIDSLGLPYRCINAGLSGETSAGGRERIDWLLQQSVSIFVLELGANDGLRGISPEATFENLLAIVEKVRAANPDCKLVLAGMKVPPSMGQHYFDQFETIFPRLAQEQNMELIPFLLEDVAGISQLNQSDGVHPTAEGQQIMAEHVWTILFPLLADGNSHDLK